MGEVASRWTDNHCHLHFREASAADVDALVSAAASEGVERLVTVGCDVADSTAAIAVAHAHPQVFATAGVHPHEADGGIEGLEALLADPQVVAVGECGLDYHYDHSDRAAQRDAFAVQIELAHRHDLALVIHTRSAWDDTFDVLAAQGVPERTVFHCFTGGPDEAQRCLAVGAHLSISGIVTFKSAQDIRDAVSLCPPERLLVETDTPYLAPVPHRGQRNRPALVPLVGAAVAEVQGRPVDDVARTSWDAAAALYRLDEVARA